MFAHLVLALLDRPGVPGELVEPRLGAADDAVRVRGGLAAF